jgi:hypothetical protein
MLHQHVYSRSGLLPWGCCMCGDQTNFYLTLLCWKRTRPSTLSITAVITINMALHHVSGTPLHTPSELLTSPPRGAPGTTPLIASKIARRSCSVNRVWIWWVGDRGSLTTGFISGSSDQAFQDDPDQHVRSGRFGTERDSTLRINNNNNNNEMILRTPQKSHGIAIESPILDLDPKQKSPPTSPLVVGALLLRTMGRMAGTFPLHPQPTSLLQSLGGLEPVVADFGILTGASPLPPPTSTTDALAAKKRNKSMGSTSAQT